MELQEDELKEGGLLFCAIYVKMQAGVWEWGLL